MPVSDIESATVDAAGQIYLTGSTGTGLATTSNAFQPAYPPNYSWLTGFLMKLDPTGSQVLYATYLNGLDPYLVNVNTAGYMYVLAVHPDPSPDGQTVFYPKPISPNAVQTSPGVYTTPTIVKIAPTGELVYATFLGGGI